MDINKIWGIVIGDSNEADKQLVLAELEQDKEAQKVYNELKNIWALLSSTKEMPLGACRTL